MPITVLIFLYVMIVIFAMLAGFIGTEGNGVKRERISLVFMLASWAVVIALAVFVFNFFPSVEIEYKLLAIGMAVFVEKVFYLIISEVVIIKKYGYESLDGEGDSELRSLVTLVIVAVMLVVGVSFTLIKLSA